MRLYNYLIFYIPGFYAKHTRFPQKKYFFRFIFTYIVPISIYLAFREISIIRLIIAFLLTYDLYEIGYIENDCETIKKEMNPTMRVSSEELVFYEKNKKIIYFTRLYLALIFSSYLIIWEESNLPLTIFPYLLIPTYLIYNRIRCRWNLLLHALLMFIRYYAPVLIATNYFCFVDAFAFLFIYPLKVMIELSVKGKFGGYKNKFVEKYILREYSNFQQFRIKYYIIGFFVTGLLFFFDIVDDAIFSMYAYFLLFTFVSMNTVGKIEANPGVKD